MTLLKTNKKTLKISLQRIIIILLLTMTMGFNELYCILYKFKQNITISTFFI